MVGLVLAALSALLATLARLLVGVLGLLALLVVLTTLAALLATLLAALILLAHIEFPSVGFFVGNKSQRGTDNEVPAIAVMVRVFAARG